jgi:hypothetical protein
MFGLCLGAANLSLASAISGKAVAKFAFASAILVLQTKNEPVSVLTFETGVRFATKVGQHF